MYSSGHEKATDYECCLLNGFYIFDGKNAAESMMSRFHKERSTIYRDKDRVLERFTEALYGTRGSSSERKTRDERRAAPPQQLLPQAL